MPRTSIFCIKLELTVGVDIPPAGKRCLSKFSISLILVGVPCRFRERLFNSESGCIQRRRCERFEINKMLVILAKSKVN